MSVPPLADDPMMGGDPNGAMLPTDDQTMGMNPDEMDMQGGEQSFNTNFDAGVEADENTDPKKYIQQLTGKLSQSLRKYNGNLPQPDSELSKYVAGMILKQTTEGLTDSDKKDIMDKVTDNGGNDSNVSNDGGNNANAAPTTPPMDGQMPTMTEEVKAMKKKHRALIDEIFQELMNGKDDQDKGADQLSDYKAGFRKKPFTAPSMDKK